MTESIHEALYFRLDRRLANGAARGRDYHWFLDLLGVRPPRGADSILADI